MPKALWLPGQALHTLDALQKAFPEKSFRLLAQVAADLQDAADRDGLPTMIADPARRGLSGLVLGKGGSLRITEVYPDSETAGALGDAGQFVEVWNSSARPISLDGWTLGVAIGSNGTTPTLGFPLTGLLPPGGYLVVTDNFDSPSEFSPPGTGSFLSVFGTRGDGVSRFGLQVRSLNLPDANGTIALFDPSGRMADVFCYGDGVEPNGRKSFQRTTPHDQLTQVLEASPFRGPDMAGGIFLEAWKLDRLSDWRAQYPTDLLGYDFRWSDAEIDGKRQQKGSERMKLGVSTADEIDQSIVDVFSAPSPHRLHVVRSSNKDGTEARYALGRLNINTCHRLALLSLDDSVRGRSILDRGALERIEKHRQSRLQAGQVPFRNPSDILPLVVSQLPDGDDRECLRVLYDQISVGSASFEVVAEYVSAAKGIGRRPSVSRQRWVVAYDQEPRRIVDYDPLY
jgi:hypothetical protein